MFEARVEDRLAIQDLTYRWCRAVDRHDLDLVRTCFHADGQAFHGPSPRSVDEMVSWLEERHPTVVQSAHMAGNILIEFTGPDTALVETYMLTHQRYAESARAVRIMYLGEEAAAQPGDLDVRSMGRYVDNVARRDGHWAIVKRIVICEGLWANIAPEHPKPGPTWPPLAHCDLSDTLYIERHAAGLK